MRLGRCSRHWCSSKRRSCCFARARRPMRATPSSMRWSLEGRAAQGLAGLDPPFDRRLVEPGLGQMMGNEFRLSDDRRELSAQGSWSSRRRGPLPASSNLSTIDLISAGTRRRARRILAPLEQVRAWRRVAPRSVSAYPCCWSSFFEGHGHRVAPWPYGKPGMARRLPGSSFLGWRKGPRSARICARKGWRRPGTPAACRYSRSGGLSAGRVNRQERETRQLRCRRAGDYRANRWRRPTVLSGFEPRRCCSQLSAKTQT